MFVFLFSFTVPSSQLTAQRPSGLSSPSGSNSPPPCLVLEKYGEAEAKAQQKEHTADNSSPQNQKPIRPGTPTDPVEMLASGDYPTKARSAVPSCASSPRSPCLPHSPPPCSPSSPRSPQSSVLTNGCLPSPVGSQNIALPKLKDHTCDSCPTPSATEAQIEEGKSGDVNIAPQQTDGPASSPAVPRKDPSRKQSRIPVLEPSSLLELPPPGSAKEKLLQKKASHQGSVPSPTASPSLSDRRAPVVASLVRDPLSSTSDRSQEEDSLMGSPSDRQGDEAPSLSSSSSPLSRKSRIPRPLHPASSAKQLNAHFLPRPPPGKPPCRPTADGR